MAILLTPRKKLIAFKIDPHQNDDHVHGDVIVRPPRVLGAVHFFNGDSVDRCTDRSLAGSAQNPNDDHAHGGDKVWSPKTFGTANL